MALISYPYCKTTVSDHARACPSCGYPIAAAQGNTADAFGSRVRQVVSTAKSRGIYIILGLLFGSSGFHDFYAGYYGKGAVKLILLLVTLMLDAATGFYSKWFLVAAGITWIWTAVSLCTTRSDASGQAIA